MWGPKMGLDVTSVLIALLALVVSVVSIIFSAYNEYWKQPRVSLALGDRISSFRGADRGQLGLSASLTFFNGGARPTAVVRMSAELTHRGAGVVAKLRWDKFEESSDVGEVGKPAIKWGFVGFADTILIPARDATAKRIQFFSEQPFDLAPGSYQLKFLAYSHDPQTSACDLEVSFDVTNEMSDSWRNTAGAPGTGLSRGSMAIFWSVPGRT